MVIKKKKKSTGEEELKAAEKYAADVVNGVIPASRWVKFAATRYFEDIRRQDELGIFFDIKAATRVIRFFKLIKHSKGEWAGQVFKLEPWQTFALMNIFGWKWKSTNLRRFRTCYIEVARKNGKSTLFAAIGIYLLAYDDEPGAEIVVGATKREQAKIVWSEAKRMVQRSSVLKKKIRTWRTSLTVESTSSKFEPLGADEDTLDGLNVHASIIDELHAHKSRGVWDVIETASGARRQPLQLAISTAGFDKHSICWEQHSYLEKILSGVLKDETYFGMIYTLDPGDDWEDESVWIKANPSLGVCVKLDDLRIQATRAKELPTQLNAFRRLRMNEWTESEVRWLPQGAWDKNQVPVDIDGLRGASCYSGLDLSSTTDLTALLHIFPPEMPGDDYRVLCRFFMPQDNITARVKQDRVPYDVWVRQGFITTTPGNVVDYEYILKQLENDAEIFDIREIGFDRWGASRIQVQLADMGFTVIPVGQGFQSLSPPMKELEKIILSGKLAHGGNPVLKWMASNVVVLSDPAGNIKPNKSKSTERIDGIVALIMGLDRCERGGGDTESIYEKRGFVCI